MFDFVKPKMFLDAVHGYIYIPREFVKNIIDTKLFQRLRNIDQTGAHIAFPNARQDRFSHSLGVFHLGQKAVDYLLYNFSKESNVVHWNIRSDNKRDNFWAKNKVLFLIACLLHDIGHAPFSHSLEWLMFKNTTASINVEKKIAEYINQSEKNSGYFEVEAKEIQGASPHEKIGACLIIDEFENIITKTLEDLRDSKFPTPSRIIYAEHYKKPPLICAEEDDVAFILRMVLRLKYKNPDPEKQIRNCFIDLLNGNQFDVDKLDYIMRDTKVSGISNISIDIERLLSSITIVTTTRYKDEYETDKKVFIETFKNGKNDKIDIEGTVFGKIQLEENAKINIIAKSKIHLLRTSTDSSKIKLLHDTPKIEKQNNEQVLVNFEPLVPPEDNPKAVLLPGGDFALSLPSVVCETDFKFKVCESSSASIEIRGYCNMTIEGGAKSESLRIDPTEGKKAVKGKVSNLTVIDDDLSKIVPSESRHNAFSIGFKKQAISVIANVLDARDYLFRWIYAHHKVVYYTQFLIPIISASTLAPRKPNEDDKTPFDRLFLNYSSISELDDYSLITKIRFTKCNDDKINQLIDQLLRRNYRISLYKSLAEYDHLFSDFSVKDKRAIHNWLGDHTDEPNKIEDKQLMTIGGFVEQNMLNEIKKIAQEELDIIEDLVWVDSGYWKKEMNPRDVYIVFPGERHEHTLLGDIELFKDKLLKDEERAHYFYIYYSIRKDMLPKNPKEASDVIKNASDALKDTLIRYFKQKLEPPVGKTVSNG